MPRVGLTRLRVISEARQLSEEIGLDQVTMTAVAHRLGVKLPSLYKHIASIAELRRDIAAIAARELGNEIANAALGHHGNSAIYSIAQAYRNWAIGHPSRYRASQLPPAPGDFRHQAIHDAVARTFTAAIAEPGSEHTAAQVDRARAARATLHGFVTLESSHSFGSMTNVDRSFNRTIHGLTVALALNAAPHAGYASSLSRTTPRTPMHRLGQRVTAHTIATDKTTTVKTTTEKDV